jgi:hypothetical protein
MLGLLAEGVLVRSTAPRTKWSAPPVGEWSPATIDVALVVDTASDPVKWVGDAIAI